MACFDTYTDQYGIRCIESCITNNIWKGIGFYTANDRLWQSSLNYLTASGKLASIFGEDYLEVDILNLQLSYTDIDLEKQFEKLSTEIQDIINYYVSGFNESVELFLSNELTIPFEFGYYNTAPFKITRLDVLRLYNYYLKNASGMFFQSFENQLLNTDIFVAIAEGYNIDNTIKIFNDIVGVYGVTKTSWPILNDGDIQHISPFSKNDQDPPLSFIDTKKSQLTNSLRNKFKSIREKLKKLNIITDIGSMGTVLSCNKTLTGNSILLYAPQGSDPFEVPSPYYLIKAKSQKLDLFISTISGLPVFFNGLFGSPCSSYYFSTCVQQNKTVSADVLFESPDNIFVYNVATIQVANSQPYTLTVYHSNNLGFVLEPSTAITLRTIFINNALECLNIFKYIYSKNFECLFKILTDTFQGDLLGFNLIGNDIQNNIYDINMGNWQRLPYKYDRRLPQGILNNQVPTNEEYQPVPAIGSYNTPFDYYACWNNPFMQGIPYYYEKAEYNRVEWIQHYIEERDDFTFENAYEVFLWMGTANDMNTGISNAQNYNSDIFAEYLSTMFIDTLLTSKTKTTMDVARILSDYNGQWINGDFNDIVYSKDISSKWILANSWTAQFMKLLLNNVLEFTGLEITQGSEPFILTSNLFVNDYKSLLLRILGLGKYKNKLYYDWTSGINLNELILQSLDIALEMLGGFAEYPWGKEKRPIFQYQSIYGVLSSQYALNRGSYYMLAEMDPKGVKFGIIMQLGNSGYVQRVGENFKLDIHFLDLASMFTEFKMINYVPFPLYENPDISICLRKFKRRKHVDNICDDSQIINTCRNAPIKVLSCKFQC